MLLLFLSSLFLVPNFKVFVERNDRIYCYANVFLVQGNIVYINKLPEIGVRKVNNVYIKTADEQDSLPAQAES